MRARCLAIRDWMASRMALSYPEEAQRPLLALGCPCTAGRGYGITALLDGVGREVRVRQIEAHGAHAGEQGLAGFGCGGARRTTALLTWEKLERTYSRFSGAEPGLVTG
jgi:hypothetical protein